MLYLRAARGAARAGHARGGPRARSRHPGNPQPISAQPSAQGRDHPRSFFETTRRQPKNGGSLPALDALEPPRPQMAFEMSLPHGPRTQALAADGAETQQQEEQQWSVYFTVQRALKEVSAVGWWGSRRRGRESARAVLRPRAAGAALPPPAALHARHCSNLAHPCRCCSSGSRKRRAMMDRRRVARAARRAARRRSRQTRRECWKSCSRPGCAAAVVWREGGCLRVPQSL